MIEESSLTYRFFTTAKLDIRASNILYHNQCYPQAIFLLEQAVEKSVKSYYLLNPDVNEAQLMGMKHDTMEIYYRMIGQKIDSIKHLDGTSKSKKKMTNRYVLQKSEDNTFEAINIGLRKELNKIVNYRANKDLSDEVLVDYINRMSYVKRANGLIMQNINNINPYKPKRSLFVRELLINQKRLFDDIIKIVPADVDLDELEKSKNVLKDDFEKSFENHDYVEVYKILFKAYFNIESALMIFYDLTKILQPHATARYPTKEFYPITFYTSDRPIIKRYPELYKLTSYSIGLLEQAYKAPTLG